MRVLLDTHALLWWLAGDDQLSPRAKRAIGNATTTVLVSAASAWEIATKVRLGKLPNADALVLTFDEQLSAQGFASLDMTPRHALRAGSLSIAHRDPFDRMLIAQAQMENVALVSNETLFDDYGVMRLW